MIDPTQHLWARTWPADGGGFDGRESMQCTGMRRLLARWKTW